MQNLELEITTPEREVIRTRVAQVSIPTTEGEITVLPGHVPLIAPLNSGELRAVDADGKDVLMAVSGGFVTVRPDGRLVILADTAERAEELDVAAIEEAVARAEAALAAKTDDAERFADATAGLARELARLKVARKRHGHRALTPPEAK